MSVSHSVKHGDCIASLGLQYGFFPDTLWNDPSNADLKKRRKDGNVLEPDDVIHIPDLRARKEDCPTDKRYIFRRRGVPAVLKLQLLKNGKPRKAIPFRLEVEGNEIAQGETDGEGRLQQYIPPAARRGKLILSAWETYDLDLGGLEPVGAPQGLRARLINLGLLAPADARPDAIEEALKIFQAEAKLPVTGKADDATSSKLLEAHGR